MKRKWENHELIEHWTIEASERVLIGRKRGANRLGFALLLKFFALKGRFPEKKHEIPRAVRTFVAEQLNLNESLYQDYKWNGRSLKYHRVEIRELYGFHRMSMHDFDEMRQWLVETVVPEAVDDRRLRQSLYSELRARQIEPPTYAQIERLLNSAQRQFEVQLCDSIQQQLSPSCCLKLDALAGPQSDSYVLSPEEIVLNQLKEEAGGVGLKSLLAELSKLEAIAQLKLPEGLFNNLYISLVERYRLRVETETLTELRRHPDPIRYTLLSAFCWLRSQEIIDNIIELFIHLVHRLESRSRKRVSEEVVAKAQGTQNHDKLLYQIAVASLCEPEGLIKDVVYPVASETQLAQLVERLGDGGASFNERLHAKLRSAYTRYYRRLLPLILSALDFRTNSSHLAPLMSALKLLKDYVGKPNKAPYAKNVDVPMEGVISAEWQAAVTTVGDDGELDVDRAAYELGVLRTVREKLRCKELWVVGLGYGNGR